jgi:hypothetical protein
MLRICPSQTTARNGSCVLFISPLILIAGLFGSSVAAQNIIQVNCQARLVSEGEAVVAFGLVQSNVAVQIDYEIELSSLSAGNIGATSQTDTMLLPANETVQLGFTRMSVSGTGFYELTLRITDRFTGSQCTSREEIIF